MLLLAAPQACTGLKRFARRFSSESYARKSTVSESGAWVLLAALEKSIEAQGVRVARVVSSLEVLLPRSDFDDSQDATECRHSNDPAFFSFLPHMRSAADILKNPIQRDHIVEMLHATRHGRRIALSTLQAIITAAAWYNQSLPNVVSLPPLSSKQQVTVVGDLHGSLSDLEAVLALTGEPSGNHTIVFNGDLADRGDHGIEVIAIVCAMVLAYPNKVYVNRGNHEDLSLSIAYGLALETQHKYGSKAFQNHFAPLLDNFFRSLPLATVIQDDALIVHGGPPPPGVSLEDVLRLERLSGDGFSRTVRSATVSQQDVDPETILEAMLWSDPSVDGESASLKNNPDGKRWKPNKSRGAGFKFDSNIVRSLLRREGLFRLVRSHEPVRSGCVQYTVGAGGKQEQSLEFYTLFSASRYPNKEGFNRGAILTLLPQGKHRIVRYDTEDDEPVMELSKVLTTTGTAPEAPQLEESAPAECDVDSITLRRVLSEAIAAHRSMLELSLEKMALSRSVPVDKLPFHDAVDVLVEVLDLEREDLYQPGPRLALAKALSKQCSAVVPDTIDLIHALDECLAEQERASYSIHLNWLHAIFAMVDTNHDGVVSKIEWQDAVATINANLSQEGSDNTINANETWELLDLDHDGFVTSDEWDSILLDVSLTNR